MAPSGKEAPDGNQMETCDDSLEEAEILDQLEAKSA